MSRRLAERLAQLTQRVGVDFFVTAALDAGEVSVDRGFIVINDPGSE